jgi:3-phosphoshikimate 1-carboxyvinyltransferase
MGSIVDSIIAPAERLSGVVRLPGDKSISHRYAMLAAIAEGPSVIKNFSSGADCHSTLDCVRALGVRVAEEDRTVQITGAGLDGFRAPSGRLDAGNSGSTIRMLSGLLAAQSFTSEIAGDESLARRPMRRILEPLGRMGARIAARDGDFPPLRITGSALRAIEYDLPVPSAQVKTAVLFAGLYAEGETVVREPVRTRDHTELALREFGADICASQREIRLRPRPTLRGCELAVPADLSSAAFFLVAGLIVPGSELVIRGVGLNPTRSALLDLLLGMGAEIKVLEVTQQAGELVGNLLVRASAIRGGVIEGSLTAAVIDEIPVLAVLGALSEEGLVVKDAAELRVKETDRIATIAENLSRLGVAVEVRRDGMTIPGRAQFRAAELDSFGDHRIAMAAAVAALRASGPCTIRGAEAASVSFPEFYETLEKLRA